VTGKDVAYSPFLVRSIFREDCAQPEDKEGADIDNNASPFRLLLAKNPMNLNRKVSFNMVRNNYLFSTLNEE
jgi:hypothetical protein